MTGNDIAIRVLSGEVLTAAEDDPTQNATHIEITGTHPYADRFPMMPDFELAELVASIEVNGQENAILVDPDGKILDGRHRYVACKMLEIPPKVEVYPGDDLADLVIRLNVRRRHLSTGVMAMTTALVLKADGRRKDGRWIRGSILQDHEIGRKWQVAMWKAGVILDTRPRLADRVVAGTMSLDAAYQIASGAKDEGATPADRKRRTPVAQMESAVKRYARAVMRLDALTSNDAFEECRDQARKSVALVDQASVKMAEVRRRMAEGDR